MDDFKRCEPIIVPRTAGDDLADFYLEKPNITVQYIEWIEIMQKKSSMISYDHKIKMYLKGFFDTLSKDKEYKHNFGDNFDLLKTAKNYYKQLKLIPALYYNILNDKGETNMYLIGIKDNKLEIKRIK